MELNSTPTQLSSTRLQLNGARLNSSSLETQVQQQWRLIQRAKLHNTQIKFSNYDSLTNSALMEITWDAGPTTGGRDPEPTSTTQQELNFSNDDSFYQSKRYIVWKAMVYDIYLGLTSMEQKNNKVTFKTFEAKVPSYLQQKNNNAMSISKRRTHEWYWEVTYVQDE